MASALIGHTGFVGGNLARQGKFDDFFNSRNIEAIAGRRYETVVCAGARAQKWLANREPEADAASLARLTDALGRVRAGRVILISTVDVYPDPRGVDETSPINDSTLQPYGKHRYELERFVRDRFPSVVVRLPGLFGEGLKKNVIFDFLHDNDVHKIHSEASFQFYSLATLWRDIGTALRHGLEVVNFATEPVRVAEAAAQVFKRDFTNAPPGVPARYDFRTRHAALFGGTGGYLQTRGQVLDALRAFVRAQREDRRAA